MDTFPRTLDPAGYGPALSRSVLILAVVGLLMRLLLLGMPMVEDNSQVRQTQTAAAAQAYLQDGFWPPATLAQWRGDLDARFLQELPLYNYAAAALAMVIGHLDAAGRLISALCWLASFFLLQLIWRRYLTPDEALWANLLVVFAPLSIAYGQAFMPEMAIQLTAFAFVLLVIRYLEQPGLLRLFWAGLVGLLGVLLKLPEISHLYVLLFVLLLLREKWGAFLRPRYWVMLIATAAVVKLWGSYLDEANGVLFYVWSASGNLEDFLGKYHRLLEFKRYVSVTGYVTLFLLTPLGVLLALWGLVRTIRERGWTYLPLLWFLSLAFFYLMWGPRTAFTHAYYNLPALAPLAALLGIGTVGFLQWSRSLALPLQAGLRYGTLVIAAGFLLFGTYYLIRPEWSAYNAAVWLRDNVKREDIVLVKSNHLNHLATYPHYAAVSYYSGNRTWIWVTGHGALNTNKKHVLATSRWFVELVPPKEPDLLRQAQSLIKARQDKREDMSWLTNRPGVKLVHHGDGFLVYQLPATT